MSNVQHIQAALEKQPWLNSLPETSKSLPSTSSKRVTVLHQAHIANLWLRLAEIYGSLFISKHGAQDSGVWFETLRDLTPIALESGLERLRALSGGTKFAEYPPNCLQFIPIAIESTGKIF